MVTEAYKRGAEIAQLYVEAFNGTAPVNRAVGVISNEAREEIALKVAFDLHDKELEVREAMADLKGAHP